MRRLAALRKLLGGVNAAATTGATAPVLPLSGVRVVDLTHVLAGPYCTYQLALMGAEVVKIEPPGGEGGRGDRVIRPVYSTQGGGKRHVTADLKSSAGKELVLKLVATADIFVENFRPGVATRLGLGVKALQAINPRLVYASLSAFGDVGPFGGRPAFDHVVQAHSGIMESTGPAGSPPTKVGAPYIDYATGLNGALAIMAALRLRDLTGAPQHVDVSMLDTSIALMSSTYTTAAHTGNAPAKMGNGAASGMPWATAFETANGGMIMLAPNTPAQALRLRDFAGLSAEFGSYREMHKRSESFVSLLSEAFLQRPAEELELELTAADIPAARIRSTLDVLAEGHISARRSMVEVPAPYNNCAIM